MGSYPVLFAVRASSALEKLPLLVRGAIRRRLNEVALAAERLTSPAADEVRNALRFEIDGHVVRYVVDDGPRTLTVLSIVRARATPEEPPER